MATVGLFFALLLSLALPALGRVAVAPERNPAGVIPDFFAPGDAAANALFPTSFISAETPIVARHAVLFTTALWNIFAAGCDPGGVALNFWGERQPVAPRVCEVPELNAAAYAHGLLAALELEFPEIVAQYGEVMAANGYDPTDQSTDMSTGVGVGNVMGGRVARWFAADGLNSLGDMTREAFRQPYEDPTGYAPVNSPWEVTHPLRWQPLTQHKGNGRYVVQSHVVPHMGYIRPLVLSPEEFASRRAPPPYLDINATTMDPRDAESMDGLVRDVFVRSASLTFEQRAQARWFDFKALSTASISSLHAQEFGWFAPAKLHILLRYLFGESLAFHDAMLLAWKEKRAYDAVRPETVVAGRLRGERVRAWVSPEAGVAEVAAEDWEPLIPTQSHSEYPSASAAICKASAQHNALLLGELVGELRPVLTVDLPRQALFPDAFGELVDLEGRNVTFVFETFEDVSRACGESRLWAGVHFGPAVAAGWELVDGVGDIAYEHVKDLLEGRVPAHCSRCT